MPDNWGEAYIEVYYPPPVDPERERQLLNIVLPFEGEFYDRDLPNDHVNCVVAWFEFPTYAAAEKAAKAVRDARNEHVEGPASW